MGPFPHDAPPATISAANPAGTDGFEFVEFAGPDAEAIGRLFDAMGFTEVARHRRRDIALYRQGGINFLLNRERDSHAGRFAAAHGPSAPAMAWRVVDAARALRHAVAHGAEEYAGTDCSAPKRAATLADKNRNHPQITVAAFLDTH